MKSYVISVSAGPGCYRHIQIGEKATLYTLHKIILKAFEFDDDHLHAFFMDNKAWSQADAYFFTPDKPDMRQTPDFTLKKLRLEAGKKFKYLFDFGDEWIFQCKVLRVLDQGTIISGIIKSVGKSPDQYPEPGDYDVELEDYDDEPDDEDDLWDDMLDNLRRTHALSQEAIDNVYAYAQAAANLYGLISLAELLELYNSQNPPLDKQQLFLALASIDYENRDVNFGVVPSEAAVKSDPPTDDLQEYTLAADYLFVEDNPTKDLRKLRRAQRGKPLKRLPREEFLQYADTDYTPDTLQRRAMLQYLQQVISPKGNMSAEDYLCCIHQILVIDAPLREAVSLLTMDGLASSRNWNTKKFSELYIALSNQTHKHKNRGFTPNELLAQSGGKQNELDGQTSLFPDAPADSPAPIRIVKTDPKA